MGYIRFDVDKIKDFVFESYKPVEVTGASEMIKLLDEGGPILEKLKTHFQDPEAKVIYARGGGGLMRVSQREKDICDWLQEEYARTVKGGKLTVVHCKAADGFPVTYALLNYKLRELKNQKALVSPPEKAMNLGARQRRHKCRRGFFHIQLLRILKKCDIQLRGKMVPGDLFDTPLNKLQIPNSKLQTIWCPSGILFTPPAISPAPVTCT